MYKIGLDLALNSVGIAIARDDNLLKYDSYVFPSKEQEIFCPIEKNYFLTNYIFSIISKYFSKNHLLIVEDIYLQMHGKKAQVDGFKHVAYIHGVVGTTYYAKTSKLPKFIQAVSARKNLAVRTYATKAELQLFIVDTFKLGQIDKTTRQTIYTNLELYKSKTISNAVHKNRAIKLSKTIESQTGISEHIADAIILTMGV